MVPWALVSPASRGIGFALARHLLQTTKSACVATTRKDVIKTKGKLLAGLDIDAERLTVLKLDVLGAFGGSPALNLRNSDNESQTRIALQRLQKLVRRNSDVH